VPFCFSLLSPQLLQGQSLYGLSSLDVNIVFRCATAYISQSPYLIGLDSTLSNSLMLDRLRIVYLRYTAHKNTDAIMFTQRKGFDYLSLPPELRNKVMESALAPGDVYVRPPKPAAESTWKAAKKAISSLLNVEGFLFLLEAFFCAGIHGIVPFIVLGGWVLVEVWHSSPGAAVLWFCAFTAFPLINCLLSYWAYEFLIRRMSRQEVMDYHCNSQSDPHYNQSSQDESLTGKQLPKPSYYKPPGHQLLSACKQTQEEGHRLFYETNTFHLPPGPVEHTQEWLNKLSSEHKKMINSVSITLSSADLTPGMLADLDECRRRALRQPGFDERDFLWIVCDKIWEKAWMPKLRLLRQWGTLNEVHVRGLDHNFTVKANQLLSADCRYQYSFIKERVWSELFGSVRHRGWRYAKSRLM